MFSYYGSKSKIVDYYPPPKFDKIIEPFAGRARYSLRYFDNVVLLVDKFDVIVNLWVYLQQCSKNDILKLPDVSPGVDIRTMNLSAEEKSLIGYCIGPGNMWPSNVPGKFNHWRRDRKRIASNLFKIKHWNIIKGCYTKLENTVATWFVDPPYFVGGHKYKYSKIDYLELSKWCNIRDGQIIVCENTKATWLPFVPITKMRGAQFTTTESIWTNYPTSYNNNQTSLF